MHTTSLEAFKRFLLTHGVDYATWGQGPTKTVDRLFYEVQTGETFLLIRRRGLLRVVRRVRIRIYHTPPSGPRLYLVEANQRFVNGAERVRSRARSVSEKMTPNESPKGAALRALKEELGFTGIERSMLIPLKSDPRIRRHSASYPGLLSEHYGPRFKLDLHSRWYRPDGYREVQPDKTTFFVWEPVSMRKK